MPTPSSFPPWLRRLGQLAGSQPPLCNGDNCACLVIPRAERGGCREVSAAASHLQDPSVPRPPPRPGPRPGAPGLTERRWLLSASRAPAALLRQPGRGWQPASAGRTRGAGQSQRRGPGRGRRSGCAALRALLGAPSAAGSTPGAGLRGRGAREGYPFPSLTPRLLPLARRQRRFPPRETTRILPGAPRPAPVLRPLPLAGEPVLARAGEEALAA